MERGAGTGGYGGVGSKSTEGEEAGGLVEGKSGSKLTGGSSEDAATEGRVEGAETVEFDGDGGIAWGGADGAASATDWFPREKELGEDAVEFGLPAGLFFAGELGEVAEGLVERWIFVAEKGQNVMADAIAGEGFVGVGGVVAPGLMELAEVGLDLGAADLEERAKDLAGAFWLRWIWDDDYWVDSAEAFGPCAAEELHEDGLGLVIESVGGEDGVGLAGEDEGGEEVVADGAGGFFDGFSGLGDAVGDAGLMDVEGNVVAGAEVMDELLIGVGFGTAQAVMDVDG